MLNAEQVVETLQPLMTPDRIARIEQARFFPVCYCTAPHACACCNHAAVALQRAPVPQAVVRLLAWPLHALPPRPGAHPAVPSRLPLQVCASRTFNVLPIVEHCYDLGNLAAVCRSADGGCLGTAQQVVGASVPPSRRCPRVDVLLRCNSLPSPRSRSL